MIRKFSLQIFHKYQEDGRTLTDTNMRLVEIKASSRQHNIVFVAAGGRRACSKGSCTL